MKRNVIMISVGIILIIGSCSGENLRRIFRTKRSEADFILRSCTASAQLIRRHRTNGVSELTADDSSLPKLASASLVLDNSKTKNFITNKNPRSTRLRYRTKGRHLIDKSTTDTPLGTVDVKALYRDVPKVFVKREPLPELDSRRGSARKLDHDAEIIVVKSLNQ